MLHPLVLIVMLALGSRCSSRHATSRVPVFLRQNHLFATTTRSTPRCKTCNFPSDRRYRGGGYAPDTKEPDLIPAPADELQQSPGQRPGRARMYAQQAIGTLFSAVGFVSSSAKSLVMNRKQFKEWKRCLEGLDIYLKDSRIHEEISSLMNRRLLGNLAVLSRIQFDALRSRDDRDLVRLRRLHRSKTLPSREEAALYAKYATAAYGEAMIRAAEMHSSGRIDTRHAPTDRSKIAKHVGLPGKDIIVADLGETDSNYLRHFIAVDHARKKVVLSIRGTFNLSEIVVDVAGFSRPFMKGEAHSEMSLMAEQLWERVGDDVRQLLQQNGKDYELVITGHSLGAGTACLLNILIHSDKRRHVHGRPVRCFSYAAPPSFAPLQAAPSDAIKSTTNYIHERDAVPFLSIDSVRHFFSCIAVIDENTKKMGFLDRQKLVTGYSPPDASLRHSVLKASLARLPPISGAPLLTVPASANIWIREKDFAGSDDYDAQDCDSTRLAKRGIIMDTNMLFDHFPTKYEHALNRLSKMNPE
mmetsp:Transcript_21464/g.47920  ORF Transcript_21464/g.47920 Transcript_21464/m.47920 type:complete len:528 (-) Transcript_21464:440-2023(-)